MHVDGLGEMMEHGERETRGKYLQKGCNGELKRVRRLIYHGKCSISNATRVAKPSYATRSSTRLHEQELKPFNFPGIPTL